jgi:hypothetical protein
MKEPDREDNVVEGSVLSFRYVVPLLSTKNIRVVVGRRMFSRASRSGSVLF